MMYMYELVCLFSFFMGLMVFVSTRKHILLTLLSLEYLVMILYLIVFFDFKMFGGTAYFILVFLVFAVCEAVLGLGILVSLIRCHGNDMLSSLNLKW